MQVFFKTDVGLVRSCNQDSCRYGKFSEDCVWSVVCDGMGGAIGGSVASSEAVDAISEVLCERFDKEMSDEDLRELMESSVTSANGKVFAMSCEYENLRGMGTTVELAVVRSNRLYVVHAGDSRVYRISGETINQVTTDHSLVQQMVERGQLTPEEARTHPGKNLITRALGVEEELELDFIEQPFEKGDVLLMCSDGLSNYFEEKEILDIIIKTPREELAEEFVELAKERGGSDNITVAIIVNE